MFVRHGENVCVSFVHYLITMRDVPSICADRNKRQRCFNIIVSSFLTSSHALSFNVHARCHKFIAFYLLGSWKYHRFELHGLVSLFRIFGSKSKKRIWCEWQDIFHWFSTTWPFSCKNSRSIFSRYCYTENPIQWALGRKREREKRFMDFKLNQICLHRKLNVFYAIFSSSLHSSSSYILLEIDFSSFRSYTFFHGNTSAVSLLLSTYAHDIFLSLEHGKGAENKKNIIEIK